MISSRTSRARLTFYAFSALLTLWLVYYALANHFSTRINDGGAGRAAGPPTSAGPLITGKQFAKHPVQLLHENALRSFNEKLARQSTTLEEAVKRYEERYRRPPPPKFDEWFKFAKRLGSPIIDDYDSIEESLRPLWGLPPAVIRARSKLASEKEDNRIMRLGIRNGGLTFGGYFEDWVRSEFENMMTRSGMLDHLPDMDLSFNMLDEPRNVVPDDQMQQLLTNAKLNFEKARRTPESERKTKFSAYHGPEKSRLELEALKTNFNVFNRQSTWSHSKMSCPMGSPTRALYFEPGNFQTSIQDGSISFVQNATAVKDLCLNPIYQLQHGFFSGPDSYYLAQNMVPIFSQAKLSTYNDILYPNYWYFAKNRAGEDAVGKWPWEKRTNQMYWRGSTTGGYSANGSWKHHHRQRFVDLVNGNSNIDVPFLSQIRKGAAWVLKKAEDMAIFSDYFNVLFSAVIQCNEKDCEDMKKHYKISDREEFKKQEKFVLDLDGNSFSGRYYTLLKSGAVVFKQTLFKEWHDERLVPWLHYIPVTMEATEVFEIMRYFREENDALAETIAKSAVDWMQTGVRPKDMKVYLFRLLLEMGRVMDDNRESLGFIMKKGKK